MNQTINWNYQVQGYIFIYLKSCDESLKSCDESDIEEQIDYSSQVKSMFFW